MKLINIIITLFVLLIAFNGIHSKCQQKGPKIALHHYDHREASLAHRKINKFNQVKTTTLAPEPIEQDETQQSIEQQTEQGEVKPTTVKRQIKHEKMGLPSSFKQGNDKPGIIFKQHIQQRIGKPASSKIELFNQGEIEQDGSILDKIDLDEDESSSFIKPQIKQAKDKSAISKIEPVNHQGEIESADSILDKIDLDEDETSSFIKPQIKQGKDQIDEDPLEQDEVKLASFRKRKTEQAKVEPAKSKLETFVKDYIDSTSSFLDKLGEDAQHFPEQLKIQSSPNEQVKVELVTLDSIEQAEEVLIASYRKRKIVRDNSLQIEQDNIESTSSISDQIDEDVQHFPDYTLDQAQLSPEAERLLSLSNRIENSTTTLSTVFSNSSLSTEPSIKSTMSITPSSNSSIMKTMITTMSTITSAKSKTSSSNSSSSTTIKTKSIKSTSSISGTTESYDPEFTSSTKMNQDNFTMNNSTSDVTPENITGSTTSSEELSNDTSSFTTKNSSSTSTTKSILWKTLTDSPDVKSLDIIDNVDQVDENSTEVTTPSYNTTSPSNNHKISTKIAFPIMNSTPILWNTLTESPDVRSLDIIDNVDQVDENSTEVTKSSSNNTISLIKTILSSTNRTIGIPPSINGSQIDRNISDRELIKLIKLSKLDDKALLQMINTVIENTTSTTTKATTRKMDYRYPFPRSFTYSTMDDQDETTEKSWFNVGNVNFGYNYQVNPNRAQRINKENLGEMRKGIDNVGNINLGFNNQGNPARPRRINKEDFEEMRREIDHALEDIGSYSYQDYPEVGVLNKRQLGDLLGLNQKPVKSSKVYLVNNRGKKELIKVEQAQKNYIDVPSSRLQKFKLKKDRSWTWWFTNGLLDLFQR